LSKYVPSSRRNRRNRHGQPPSFQLNSQNGEIVYFGNYQNVPEEFKGKFSQGVFRVASDIRVSEEGIKGTGKKRIIEFYPKHDILNTTTQLYNKYYGFRDE